MAGANSKHTSTQFSEQRYAHPFFLPAPPSKRQAINGHVRMIDWIKKNLGPVPAVRNGGRLNIEDVIGADGANQIEQAGEIRFHALGDSGVGDAHDAEKIADEMAADFTAGADSINPAFLFHLGDVIYGTDKDVHYGDRFYRPYRHYPGKIIAIPGNHDGEEKSPADSPSLKAFQANFCAKTAAVPPQASDSAIFRKTMTQPGVYWLLDAPFARIIGLYSNRAENPGFLQGLDKNKNEDTSQIDWLKKTLEEIAAEKEKKALVIATHHPPFSQGNHSGSTEMSATIDDLCKQAGVMPDLFLSAHAHNYQRYIRRLGGKQVPYIVVGTGGIGVQPVVAATGQPIGDGTTYEASISSHGYLFVTVSRTQLKTEFWQLGQQHTRAFDTVTVDLAKHVIL